MGEAWASLVYHDVVHSVTNPRRPVAYLVVKGVGSEVQWRVPGRSGSRGHEW